MVTFTHLSFFAVPIFYLPYPVIKCVGISSTLGVPSFIQLGIDLSLLIGLFLIGLSLDAYFCIKLVDL